MATVPWRKLGVIGGSVGAGFALACALVFAGVIHYRAHVSPPRAWDSNAFKATYVGAQLKEIDRGNAGLILYYDLENKTDFDYRLADKPGVVIMRRLKSTRSLSSEERIRLSYPTFLPERQRARIALEVLHPFNWPSENDPALQDKLKDFVNRRLADVDAFVLFDEPDRCQIELPGGWQELQLTAAAQK